MIELILTLVIVIVIAVAVLSVKFGDSERAVQRYKAERRMIDQKLREKNRELELLKKTEVINDQKDKNHDNATTFDGSIDVLSDLAARSNNRVR